MICGQIQSILSIALHPCLTDPWEVGILRGDGRRRSKIAWGQTQRPDVAWGRALKSEFNRIQPRILRGDGYPGRILRGDRH